MATDSDIFSKNLAANLIALRKTKGLSQLALAKLAGTTRATITLIESGAANPNLSTLTKLCGALNMSLDELISSPRAECQHIKSTEIPLDRRSRKGVTLRKILPDKTPASEIDELLLESGASLIGAPHVEGTKEYFTCLDGEITVTLLGESYRIKKGDVLSFPGNTKHSYKNLGTKKARGISVVFFNPLR